MQQSNSFNALAEVRHCEARLAHTLEFGRCIFRFTCEHRYGRSITPASELLHGGREGELVGLNRFDHGLT